METLLTNTIQPIYNKEKIIEEMRKCSVEIVAAKWTPRQLYA